MIYTEEMMQEVCSDLFQEHFDLAEQARLNGGTCCSILGLSRSRYLQIRKETRTVVQVHIFLNLLESNARIREGLEEGWLPATSNRGKAQEVVRKQLLES